MAVSRTKPNDNYLEVELSEISFRKKEYDDFESEERRFGLTFEMGKFPGKLGNIERLKYGFGVSAGLYYRDYIAYALRPQDFNSEGASARFLMKLIPRLTYRIHDRILLDLNMPLQIINIAWIYTRSLNPNLTIRQQEHGIFSFDKGYFQHVLRLGDGYVFK